MGVNRRPQRDIGSSDGSNDGHPSIGRSEVILSSPNLSFRFGAPDLFRWITICSVYGSQAMGSESAVSVKRIAITVKAMPEQEARSVQAFCKPPNRRRFRQTTA